MTRATSAELKEYLEFSHRLADISGAAILPYFRKSIAVRNKAGKTGFDPVTAADRAAERAIRKAVTTAYPEHGIVGEEFGQVAGAGRFGWVIDPIDGTRAFIAGREDWSVSAALVVEGRPVAAALFAPATEELFLSSIGSGAMRNLSLIHI